MDLYASSNVGCSNMARMGEKMFFFSEVKSRINFTINFDMQHKPCILFSTVYILLKKSK